LGWAGRRAVFGAGYDADVLVVDGDLAADITALRHVRQVVLRGVPVSPLSGQT
jgi:imidazolonepropionase-like amidohydrolase